VLARWQQRSGGGLGALVASGRMNYTAALLPVMPLYRVSRIRDRSRAPERLETTGDWAYREPRMQHLGLRCASKKRPRHFLL